MSESEVVENIGSNITTDLGQAENADEQNGPTKISKDPENCPNGRFGEGISELRDFSLGCSSVFFDNSPVSCPQFAVGERIDPVSISKSSSIILEEEEEEVSKSQSESGLSDNDGDDDASKSEQPENGNDEASTTLTTSPTQADTEASQHRWSNSRSTKFFVARGEFNRSVYSDSRRRPLSCTPPSTSLSTSASVEEDDEVVNVVNHAPALTSTESSQTVENLSVEEEGEIVDQHSNASSPIASTFLPDLLQLGQQQRPEETNPAVVHSGNDTLKDETAESIVESVVTDKKDVDTSVSTKSLVSRDQCYKTFYGRNIRIFIT
jgi:hypothetical protein